MATQGSSENSASSTENEQLVRNFFAEALNHGDMDLARAVIAGDSKDHGSSLVGSANGIEGFERVASMFRQAMPDLQYQVEEIHAWDDKVVTRWTAHGTFTGELQGVKPTHKQASTSGIVIYRIAKGKIEESWGNWDALGLLEQLGIVGANFLHRSSAAA